MKQVSAATIKITEFAKCLSKILLKLNISDNTEEKKIALYSNEKKR